MKVWIVGGISLLLLLLIVGTVVLIFQFKKRTGGDSASRHFSNPNAKIEQADYTYMICERCHKRNYVNKNSLHKLCNNCGWNLTEPYVHKTVHIKQLAEDIGTEQLAKMNVNDRLYVYIDHVLKEGNKMATVSVYDGNYRLIGTVDEEVAKELIPKIDMCAKVFGKIKKKHPHGLEILITNDVQKMWSF
ncbi:OB-fold nucleic acid binding domain-containing protein [Fervidibacillus albus]|uniref:OB-fold nucleic acid binding domain-containing protein n=1 Tax=Fervidibacillus albus TaxID=2980026 RepID=A0A9E8RWN7_9BACI|nr:hypothetical protein [Fervidibacillus albus]WAA08612.1 OB-fold nucleic acid binding domain-containing protein [Fervidibacillus albus]